MHGRDDGDVVEVGAAGEGVVDDDLVARRRAVGRARRWRRAPTPASNRGAPGCARPATSSSPSAVNSGGRAVGPLLDVRAGRGPPQHRAHLVGDAGRAATRSTWSAAGIEASRHALPPQHERAGRARLGPPAVGHPDRAVGLGEHDGPGAGRRPVGAGRSVDRRAAPAGAPWPGARPPRPACRAGRSRCGAGARRGSRRRVGTVSSWLWPA